MNDQHSSLFFSHDRHPARSWHDRMSFQFLQIAQAITTLLRTMAEFDAVKAAEANPITPYMRLITDGKNPRGIPGAKFIDGVEKFLENESIEAALGALNEVCDKSYLLQTFKYPVENDHLEI